MTAHFFLFPKVETALRKKIQDTKGIKKVSTKLCEVPVNSFVGCFVKHLKRCKICVAVVRDYLEEK